MPFIKTELEMARFRLPATSWSTDSATTATLIHSSGVMARRDHPRADRQCRKIKISTVPVSTSDPGTLAALTAFHTDWEPSTSSRCRGS